MRQSFTERLLQIQQEKNTRLCVGLDIDTEKLPLGFGRGASGSEALLLFGREIVDATQESACIFKINHAFFASLGAEDELAELIQNIHHQYGIPVILDGKRGDIGNTGKKYAQEAFDRFGADACTFNPYLGPETIDPFLTYGENHAVFALCHTSNPDAAEFQELSVKTPEGEMPFYIWVARRIIARRQEIAEKMKKENKGEPAEVGLVTGATFPIQIRNLAKMVPEKTWLLIPGIGKQEGALEETVHNVREGKFNFVINVSRAVIHASQKADFAVVAAEKARQFRDQINQTLAA